MKRNLLVAAASLALATSAFAQGQSPADHQQHHLSGSSSTAQAQTSPPSTPAQPPGPQSGQPQGQMPMGQMMQGMPGMMGGQGGMMNCPMMRGGMAAMMGGRGMGAMSGTAMRQGGDESVPSLAFRAVNERMHRDMAIELSGNVDADFARAMMAHHQGAIDMAKIAIAFGKDPEVRKLAEDVVRTQEPEIAVMRDWLAKQPK